MFNKKLPMFTFIGSAFLAFALHLSAFGMWVFDYNTEFSFALSLLGTILLIPLTSYFTSIFPQPIRRSYILLNLLHSLCIFVYLFPFSLELFLAQCAYAIALMFLGGKILQWQIAKSDSGEIFNK